MEYTLSRHASDVVREREIPLEWIAAAMVNPVKTEADPDDPELLYALRPIEDFGYRVLRVVFNKARTPPHVVTV